MTVGQICSLYIRVIIIRVRLYPNCTYGTVTVYYSTSCNDGSICVIKKSVMEFITIHIFIVLLKPVCISMQSSPCCPLFLSPDTVHDYRKGTCNSPFAIRNLQNTIQHCLVKGLIYVVLLCQSDLFTTTSVNIRPIQYFGYQMCFLLKNKVILCMTLSLKSMIHDSKIITNFTGIFFYLSKNCPHGTFLTS